MSNISKIIGLETPLERRSNGKAGKNGGSRANEVSDAARLLGLAKRPGLPSSIDEHDDLPIHKNIAKLHVLYLHKMIC